MIEREMMSLKGRTVSGAFPGPSFREDTSQHDHFVYDLISTGIESRDQYARNVLSSFRMSSVLLHLRPLLQKHRCRAREKRVG